MKVKEFLTRTDLRIINLLNVLVLISALAIIADLSYSIIMNGHYNPSYGLTLKIQLGVCVVFMFDFVVRLSMVKERWAFVKRNFLLLLFAVPYLNIMHHWNPPLTQQGHYLLSLVPLLRAGFGLSMIIGWYTRRSSTSLMFAYLAVLSAALYFGTLLFFVSEKGVNPGVHTFWDAVWWALMDATTVGSNIIAVTTVGKVLSVLLAALGIMMLPVFTVYITDKMQVMQKRRDNNYNEEHEK